MSWLSRNTDAIRATAAVVTATTAVLAAAGILLQMRAAGACALIASPRGAAHAAYVDHLLYAAEQMLDADPGWDKTFVQALEPHAQVLCAANPGDDSVAMTAMLAGFRASHCPNAQSCQIEG